MTVNDVYKYYGSARQCALALGLAFNTPLHWKRIGYVPLDKQMHIEKHTQGKLKANWDDIPSKVL